MSDPMISTETYGERYDRRMRLSGIGMDFSPRSGPAFDRASADAHAGAQQEMLAECHAMLRRLMVARSGLAAGISEHLLLSLAMAIEPDDTAVNIKLDHRHGVTVCNLGQLKAIARMALASTPLTIKDREHIEMHEANLQSQRFQDLANKVKVAVLTEIVNRKPPGDMQPLTAGQVNMLGVMATEPFDHTSISFLWTS